MIGKTNILGSINKGGFWLDGWKYGKKITVPKSKVDAELTNFPLTVYLNDTNFDFTKAEADGKDIRFTDGELNHLTFERKEHIAGTTKSAVYNVKIPTVSNTEDTEIYMWYGNSSATDTANTTGDVWDDNYVMVQHMGDSLVDASGNGNNGTATGTTVVNTDYGKARSFNGTSDVIATLAKANASEGTLVILNNPLDSALQDLWVSDDGAGYCMMGYATDTKAQFGIYDTGSKIASSASSEKNGFNTFTGRYKTGEAISLTVGTTKYTGAITTNIGNVATVIKFGKSGTSYPLMILAGARLSNIARSDAWIKAESLALKNELITQADL